MHDVYRRAIGTIAATGASESSVGCFAHREPTQVQGLRIIGAWDGVPKQAYDCYWAHYWHNDVDNSPLSKRGWALQERVLSTRVIHFGSEQVVWECCELSACETLPEGIVESVPGTVSSLPAISMLTPANSDRKLFKAWKLIVELYMRSSLTKSSDRTIALSGLAEEFRLKFEDQYVAGLWGRSLHRQLLWRTVQNNKSPSRSPSAYRAPSWSWLSIDAEVDVWPDPALEEIESDSTLTLIEILDVQIHLLGSNKTGQMTGGFVKIRGFLNAAIVHMNPDRNVWWYLHDDKSHWLGPIAMAWDRIPPANPKKLFYLPVLWDRWRGKSIGGSTGNSGKGLLLAPTGKEGSCYRRVGYFSTDSEYVWGSLLRQRRLSAPDGHYQEIDDATMSGEDDDWCDTDSELNDDDFLYEPLTKRTFTIV